MANKKRMYKKGSFPGMEPNKELTFGGMKYRDGGPAARQREEAEKAKAAAEKIEAAKAIADRRGPSREEKQNTPQGTGSGRTEKSGSNAGPKPGTYAYAKKRNPNLDKLIAERKKYAKGTEDYNRVQNQINRAYDKGPMRKEISKLTPKSPPKNTAKPTIQKPASAKPKAEAKPAPKKRSYTNDMLSMSEFQSAKGAAESPGSAANIAKFYGATSPEAGAAKRNKRDAASVAAEAKKVASKRSSLADRRNSRKASKRSRLEKRLAKL